MCFFFFFFFFFKELDQKSDSIDMLFKVAITPVKMYSSDSIKNFPGFPWPQYFPTLPILSTSNQKGMVGFII